MGRSWRDPHDRRAPARELRFRIGLGAALVGFLIALAAWALRGPAAPRETPVLTLYGFSAVQDVLQDDLLPAFERRVPEGGPAQPGRPEIVAAFAGSGRIVVQVLRELPIDVAVLASAVDRLRLDRRGLLLGRVPGVPDSIDLGVHTPVVLVVRPGNPLGFHDFPDLARPGVAIVHPDPETSGAGEWGVLAAWAAASARGLAPDEAAVELASIWRNVVERPSSARLAHLAFEAGRGDVLVTWEAEARAAARAGRPLGEVVVPPVTATAEPVVVTIPRHVATERREHVAELVRWLRSDTARARFAAAGFRTFAEPAPTTLVRLEALGGPAVVERDVIRNVWQSRIRPTLPPPGP